MRKFKDHEGRSWKVNINYASIRKVRDADIGVDLATLLADEMKGYIELQTDPILFIDTLWVLLEGQHDITQEEFAEGMFGDGLGDAVKAFCKAFADFCPSHQRKMLSALMAKGEKMSSSALKTIENLNVESVTFGDSDGKPLDPTDRFRELNARLGNSSGEQPPIKLTSGTEQLKRTS